MYLLLALPSQLILTCTCCADEETRKAVQCVFITLDPERDSVAQVKQYTKEFSKDFIGLTGSSQQVIFA